MIVYQLGKMIAKMWKLKNLVNHLYLIEIPYHADICESFKGLDKVSSGKTSGNGFYYLVGDIARLHEATLAYARRFYDK